VVGLARVAVTSWLRAASWTVETTVRGGSELVRLATSGDPPHVLAARAGDDLRRFAQQLLGVDEPNHAEPPPIGTSTAELQAKGAELLRRSADVSVTDEGHPAFARILSELTPDEARVLRFLYREGPQPAVDVRTNRPFGVGSELIESGLNMIAEQAGCRYVDRINSYLTNLARLGLVRFSTEEVDNPNRYQLVEAQPKVAEAMKRAGRSSRTVHRSIHLTEFGTEFCRVCLPPEPRAPAEPTVTGG
jgi:abortive infection alpha-like protein